MDIARFDGLTRSVSILLSRRAIAGALGLGAIALPMRIDARKKRKKRKKKKKKVKLNEFGCVNVGSFCQTDAQCCSGICQGKKGEKRCQAHDQATCQVDASVCQQAVLCLIGPTEVGACFTTTGNAGYCAAAALCFPCSTDADCQPICGAQAACVRCANCDQGDEPATACVGTTQGSCVAP